MRKNQYYPFDDFNSCIIWLDMQGKELPWEEVARRLREIPREQRSVMLSYLTDIYRTELENNGEIKALEKFWREVNFLSHGPGASLTGKMLETLQKAEAGNIKAAQVMVKANPVVIHLPFIARILRYVVSQHKYCDAKIFKDKASGTVNNVLKDVKKINWDEFLPSRDIGRITYDKEDLRKLIELVRKQENHSQLQAIELVSEALNISEKSITKRLRIKGRKPGRPKKQ